MPPVTGTESQPVAVPDTATIVVTEFSEWVAPTVPADAGYRFVIVTLSVAADTAPLDLTATSLPLLDRTGHEYVATGPAATPILKLPVTVASGKKVTGVLTYLVPIGGSYRLAFDAADGQTLAVISLSSAVPDMAAVAAAYLKLAVSSNKDADADVRRLNAAGCNAANLGAAYAAFATHDEQFTTAVSKLVFPDSAQSVVARLLSDDRSYETTMRALAGDPRNASLLQQEYAAISQDNQDAVQVRQALALPPYVAAGPSVTNSCA